MSVLNIGLCVAFMCVCDICEHVFASVYVHTHVGVSVCIYIYMVCMSVWKVCMYDVYVCENVHV